MVIPFHYGKIRAMFRVATQSPLAKYRDIQTGEVVICRACAAKQVARTIKKTRATLVGLLAGTLVLIGAGFYQPMLWILAMVILPFGLLYVIPLYRRRWNPDSQDDLLLLFEREISSSLGYKPQAIKLWSQGAFQKLSQDSTYKV